MASLRFVLVSEELVVQVLTVIFALRARLVLIFAEECLLLVDKSVESLQLITWILLKLLFDELALFGENILDGLSGHSLATKDISASLSADVLLQVAILIEQQAWHILVLETFSAFVSLDLHPFASRVLDCQLLEGLFDESRFGDAKNYD